AVIDVGGVGGLVLAAQAVCNDGGEATDNEAFGIDDHPLLLHLGGLLNESRHCLSFSLIPRPEGWGVSCCLNWRILPPKQKAGPEVRDPAWLIPTASFPVKTTELACWKKYR